MAQIIELPGLDGESLTSEEAVSEAEDLQRLVATRHIPPRTVLHLVP